jgi:hypothetical protein
MEMNLLKPFFEKEVRKKKKRIVEESRQGKTLRHPAIDRKDSPATRERNREIERGPLKTQSFRR